MADFNDICYKKNYLTDVILRVDFVSPVLSITDQLPKSITDIILKDFPIKEPREAAFQQVQVNPKEVKTEKRIFTEWNFFGRNREKSITLTTDFFFIAYKKYEIYENMKREFESICNIFFETFNEAQANRLGLRYINQIEAKEDGPINWGNYINNNLLGLLGFKINGSTPTRIFHNYEAVFEESYSVRFQFGLFNPDYPAPIKRNLFVLDYDAYYQGLIETQEISSNIDKYHDSVQMMFEQNITNKLRAKMNE